MLLWFELGAHAHTFTHVYEYNVYILVQYRGERSIGELVLLYFIVKTKNEEKQLKVKTESIQLLNC